jgi:hypothetical protein
VRRTQKGDVEKPRKRGEETYREMRRNPHKGEERPTEK